MCCCQFTRPYAQLTRLCGCAWRDKRCATKTGTPKDTRATCRVWSVSSSDGADDGSLGTVVPADGDDGYSFEAPGDHSMKCPSMTPGDIVTMLTMEGDDIPVGDVCASVLVFESGKSRIHDGVCSTPDPTSIFCKSACARLALESLGAVGRCYSRRGELA
jgi:hypothetical protein